MSSQVWGKEGGRGSEASSAWPADWLEPGEILICIFSADKAVSPDLKPFCARMYATTASYSGPVRLPGACFGIVVLIAV